jgi:hypothetical protein
VGIHSNQAGGFTGRDADPIFKSIFYNFLNKLAIIPAKFENRRTDTRKND